MRNYTKLLSVWSVLSAALTLAATGTLVLSASSCRSHRHLERTETVREDSLTVRSTASVTVTTALQSIAGDSVSLRVPLTLMASLPDGALFTGKRGRTRVSLRRDGVNIVAEAESDSVPREVTRYEHRARDSLQYRGGAQAAETSKEKDMSPAAWYAPVFIPAVLAIIILIVFKR